MSPYGDYIPLLYIGTPAAIIALNNASFCMMSSTLLHVLGLKIRITDIQSGVQRLVSIHFDPNLRGMMKRARSQAWSRLIRLMSLSLLTTVPGSFIRVYLKPNMNHAFMCFLTLFLSIRTALVQGIFFYMLSMNCFMIRMLFIIVCWEIHHALEDEHLNVNFIQDQRHNHHLAIQLVKKSNKIWKFWIPIYSTFASLVCIVYMYSVFFLNRPAYTNAFSMVNIVTNIHLMSIIITEVTSLNRSASKPYHDLYKTTFGNRSSRFKTEAQLFLHRINRRDIGFTFFDLFVITPEILWTFFTVISTSIVAIPSLKKPVTNSTGFEEIDFNDTLIEFEGEEENSTTVQI